MACFSVASALLALTVAASATQQVFKSGVDAVIIPVAVRSGNKPVTGLTVADFELRDSGVVQEIRSVEAESIPIDVTLLLDLSSSVDGPMLLRLKTAVADTAALLRSDDRIRLVAISQVLREVFSLRPNGEAMPLDTLAAEGATSLYDGIAATMMRATPPGRRQLIVAFSDGRDSTSIIDEKNLREIARLTDAVVDIVVPVSGTRGDANVRRLAQRNTVDSLQTGENVNLGGRGSTGDGTVPPVLAELVGPTSGQVFQLGTDDSISHVFKAMLDDFRASYVLQYVPRGVPAEGWHEVSVAVKKHPKYEIRARKGYKGRSKITVSEVRR